MEDLHPDHQILLLLSLTQLWWNKSLACYLYNIGPFL